MTILGIETATERLCAALLTREGSLFERRTDSRSSHCELIAGFITELSAESGVPLDRIEGIAVSAGPGSFTGLRIGIATAMGIAYGLGIPACGVNTLAALAWNAEGSGVLVCPLIDAKRSEVYAAVYRTGAGIPVAVVEPAAVPISRLAAILDRLGEPVTLTGPAAETFRPILEAAGTPPLAIVPPESAKPSAGAVARLGRLMFASGGGGSPASLSPVYLRRSDAELAKPKPSPFAAR
jgi:tRNA threonylcarbamoyladenosine biosynthesis protein TsaB